MLGFLGVMSLVTGESRVTGHDSLDITEDCDAPVICDMLMLQKMLFPFLKESKGFLNVS